MAVFEAMIFGFCFISFILFELWFRLRDDHPNIALLFFGMGLVMVDVVGFTLYQFIINEAVLFYLIPFALPVFMVLMWFTVGITFWMLYEQFVGFGKIFANWLFIKCGFRAPFKGES